MSRLDASFRFHNKCEKQKIINLCFADDLFLFAKGEVHSARCIMESLTKFTKMSGLVPSIQKSTAFFCNVPTFVKSVILELMTFVEGSPCGLSGLSRISSRVEVFGSVVFQLIVVRAGERFYSLDRVLDSISGLELATGGPLLLVSDVWADGGWRWPLAWRDSFPVLIHASSIIINNYTTDRFLWKDGDILSHYSLALAWESIRSREPEIQWVSIVWFTHCIPKHAFLLWLIMRRKLLTQDKIIQWDFERRKNMNMTCCPLCYSDYDSHQHLFFECPFSMQVWYGVRGKAGMSNVDPKISAIVEWLLLRSKSKSAGCLISKLVVAASTYVIWQERNDRLFKNQTRPPDIICNEILQTVRYKLLGVKFKDTASVRRLLDDWDIRGDDGRDNGD
ncbi:uncharacterized protein LOC110942755 [Helianthus annuus]|uniref:uncharacterized protein LOC110942755 n=1 Tax=Helianthus annuus TaxID=4232 RepID=UPI000B901E5A|nr:uncharacterized protein LOC110942755 [Helianthus annuus]